MPVNNIKTPRNKYEYDSCPKCYSIKSKRSATCRVCWRQRLPIEQPPDSSIRHIRLTQGKFAIVDATDYEQLNQWNWNAAFDGVNFYASRRDGKYSTRMHRVILGLARGDHREGEHVNGNTLDNRRLNLRIATHQNNSYNRKKGKNNTSGFKGVSFIKKTGKWQARISVNRTEHSLGHYPTKELAAEVYNKYSVQLHGEFARKN